jgi:hypothetical protein
MQTAKTAAIPGVIPIQIQLFRMGPEAISSSPFGNPLIASTLSWQEWSPSGSIGNLLLPTVVGSLSPMVDQPRSFLTRLP